MGKKDITEQRRGDFKTMMEICPNCGEGEAMLVYDSPYLEDGFYCENCFYKMADFVEETGVGQ